MQLPGPPTLKELTLCRNSVSPAECTLSKVLKGLRGTRRIRKERRIPPALQNLCRAWKNEYHLPHGARRQGRQGQESGRSQAGEGPEGGEVETRWGPSMEHPRWEIAGLVGILAAAGSPDGVWGGGLVGSDLPFPGLAGPGISHLC